LAQLKMVGPHIDFGDNTTFELFRYGNALRAIKDQGGFAINTNQTLPAHHPIQQHRQQHDPPVRSNISYDPPEGWVSLAARVSSSVSSFVKSIVIGHFWGTHQLNSTSQGINRHADNSRLITLLPTQSPHTPVEGCTSTTASRRSTDGMTYRHLVLTDAGHPFFAWITVMYRPNFNTVMVEVYTTEPAVSGGGGAFKGRFPETTRLARVVLGASIAQRIFER